MTEFDAAFLQAQLAYDHMSEPDLPDDGGDAVVDCEPDYDPDPDDGRVFDGPGNLPDWL